MHLMVNNLDEITCNGGAGYDRPYHSTALMKSNGIHRGREILEHLGNFMKFGAMLVGFLTMPRSSL